MVIGIDVRCLAEGRRTGVEEYTLNVLEYLFRIDQKNRYVLFFNSFKKPGIDFAWIKKYPNVSVKIFRFPNKLMNFFLWYFRWPHLDRLISGPASTRGDSSTRGGVDIFFMPNINFGSVSKKCQLVLTIHDLSFEKFTETFSWKRRLWHVFVNPRHITRRARKIVAVSHSTKHDLLTLYRTPAEKIETIWSGVNNEFREIDKDNIVLRIVREKYKLPEKFILYFGTIEPRKNIQGLVRAYNEFRIMAEKNGNTDLLEYDLVIAGYPGWASDAIYTEIKNSRYQYHIFTIEEVAGDDKVALYNCAAIFAYPSFYEGFGFPALEAMKCGIPTIVSNSSSLPEVVNSGALLVDPDKPSELCDIMSEVLSSPELHAKLKKAGLERSQEFRWEKTAEKMLAMFNKMK